MPEKTRRRRRTVLVSVLGLAVGLLGPWLLIWTVMKVTGLGDLWEDAEKTEARVFGNGRPIIAALEAYHVAEGTFPEQLEVLKPRYLEAIPKPEWGVNAWEYGGDRDGFSLKVRLWKDQYQGYTYYSAEQDWVGDF